MEQRFYYKDEKGNKYSFKSEQLIKLEDGKEIIEDTETGEKIEVPKYKYVPKYIPITEEEFNTKPQISEEAKARFEKQKQIAELKTLLAQTDYIANKLSEAQVIYIVTGDNTKMLELYNKYKDLIIQREEWRNQIDELEK